MKINDNTFAFTAWLVKNTHVETETGLTEFDGYDWYNYMWEKWLQNTDKGKKITNDLLKNTMNNNLEKTIDSKTDLETVTFTFTQATNCVDGPSHDIETLVVEAKSSLGIDGDGGAFYVLRTKQWAVDGVDEINEIVKRCEKAIEAVVKK
jgi:hypothetical protein